MPKRAPKPPKMLECEMKRIFKVDGVKSSRWIVRAVKGMATAPLAGTLRCMHCQGAVRFFKQKFADGPEDHVEHVSKVDSEGCQGGRHFKGGEHTRSASPVL